MIQIVDIRGSGKTSKLMLLAQENNGIFVCFNPDAMKVKAKAYGLTGFDIISFSDYIEKKYTPHKPIYIDELEHFVRSMFGDIEGYSLTIGD